MKRTLYIHIGHAKCGSSTIQRFLSENRLQLLKFNFLYPQTFSSTFHSEISPVFWKNARLDDRSEGYLNTIMDEIDKSPAENVVISSETFHADDPRIFLHFKEKFNVKIVYFIRPYDEWWDSVLKQTIVDKKFNIPSSNFTEWPRDFSDVIYEFSEKFGNENILVETLNNNDDKQLLIAKFLRGIGCNLISPNQVKTENESLSDDNLGFMAHLQMMNLSHLFIRDCSNYLRLFQNTGKKNITFLDVKITQIVRGFEIQMRDEIKVWLGLDKFEKVFTDRGILTNQPTLFNKRGPLISSNDFKQSIGKLVEARLRDSNMKKFRGIVKSVDNQSKITFDTPVGEISYFLSEISFARIAFNSVHYDPEKQYSFMIGQIKITQNDFTKLFVLLPTTYKHEILDASSEIFFCEDTTQLCPVVPEFAKTYEDYTRGLL